MPLNRIYAICYVVPNRSIDFIEEAKRLRCWLQYDLILSYFHENAYYIVQYIARPDIYDHSVSDIWLAIQYLCDESGHADEVHTELNYRPKTA